MQRYLISYEFTDGEDQEEGAEMLINWYESGKQWHPWRRLMDISIQPCMDLDETVGLFKKQKMNTRIV